MHIGAALLLLFSLSISLGSATSGLTNALSSKVLVAYGDFGLSASPSMITVNQGGISGSTITVTGQGGYSGNVTFSLAETYDSIDIQASTTPSFVVISGTQPQSTSMLHISTLNGVRPGNYTISIEAFDGSIQHSAVISLHVTGQDFAITSSPSRLIFPANHNATQTASIVVRSLGGLSGDVNLTIAVGSSFPGVTQIPSASPSSTKVSITPTTPMSFSLAVTVNSSMISAPYSATISGVARTSIGGARSYDLVFNIGPDFNMTDTMKNMIVHQGAMSVSTVTYTSLNGFVGQIGQYAGTISSNPPNPDIRFYPSATIMFAGGTNVTRLVVRADSRTGLGTYSLVIEASDVSGNTWLGESLPFNVTVLGPITGPDFTIYADPVQLSTSLGTTVTSTINLLGFNGFTGPLTLFASSYRITPTLSPGSVSLTPLVNATSTLTVNIPLNLGEGGGYTLWWFASGGYPILVIASDPTGFSHEAWVNITATPFTVVASPARLGLKAGSTATFNLNVNGIGQFNDTVMLSARGSGGVSATPTNRLLNFSGAPSSLSSNLTVNVPLGTPDGDYVVQVIANYMRPSYICSCAPKYPLNYTVPVDVLVTSTASSAPTILGLLPIEFYGIIAAAGGAVVILSSYLLIRRGKQARMTNAPN